jgi:hypothetical protein
MQVAAPTCPQNVASSQPVPVSVAKIIDAKTANPNQIR